MQHERENKRRDCSCKLFTRTVKAFFECLRFRNSSSSSSDMVKSKARNEKEDEGAAVETSARSVNLTRKRRRKQPVSSGKPGGVNNYDM